MEKISNGFSINAKNIDNVSIYKSYSKSYLDKHELRSDLYKYIDVIEKSKDIRIYLDELKIKMIISNYNNEYNEYNEYTLNYNSFIIITYNKYCSQKIYFECDDDALKYFNTINNKYNLLEIINIL